MGKKKKRKPIKHRNPFALHASTRKATKFKDKREPRGGNRNKQRDYKEEE